MRILHVNKYFHEEDGVGRYLFWLMRAQEAAGHVVAPFAMHDPRNRRTPWEGFFAQETDTSGVGRGFGAFHQLRAAWWNREAYARMKEMLRAFQPDIVHVHNAYTHLSPSVVAACKEEGVPVVMTVHDFGLVSANYGLWDGRAPLVAPASFARVTRSRFIKRSMLATAVLEGIVRLQRWLGYWDGITTYITLSSFVKNTIVAYGVPAENVVVASPASAPLAQNYVPKKAARAHDVLFVGRLERYKGIDTVLALARADASLSIGIIGGGPEEARMRYEATHLPNVSLYGRQPGSFVWDMMASAGAVVAPSRWPEPFGLVALEALSVGTPVIVSDRGGLPEIVNDACGAVVSADDVAAFTAAVKRLRRVKGARAAALARARELGDPTAALAAVMKVYQDAVTE